MPKNNQRKDREIQLSSQILDYQALNDKFTSNQNQIQHYLHIILLNIKAENIGYESVQSTIDELLHPSRSHAFSQSFISFLKTTKKRFMIGSYLDDLVIELISIKSAYTTNEIHFILDRPNPKRENLNISILEEKIKAGSLALVAKWASIVSSARPDNLKIVREASLTLAKHAHSEGIVIEKQPYELDETHRLKKTLRRKEEKLKRLMPLLDKHLKSGVQQGYLVGKKEKSSDVYWAKEEGNVTLDELTSKLSRMNI